MQINLDAMQVASRALEGWKFWAGFVGFVTTVPIGTYRIVRWVKEVRETDIPEVKESIISLGKRLEEKLEAQIRSTDAQTKSLVSEFKEMRADLRLLYTINPPVQRRAMAAARKPSRKGKTINVSLELDKD